MTHHMQTYHNVSIPPASAEATLRLEKAPFLRVTLCVVNKNHMHVRMLTLSAHDNERD